MTIYENGHRFIDYDKFEHRLHRPYDYQKHGLIEHLVSKKITESKNKLLKAMLSFVDRSFVFTLKYIDELKYFKNYLWKNR